MSKIKYLKQVWAKSEGSPWWPGKSFTGHNAEDLDGVDPETGTTVVFYQSYSAEFVVDESLIKEIEEADLSEENIEARIKEVEDENEARDLRTAIMEAKEDRKLGLTMDLVELGNTNNATNEAAAELKELEAMADEFPDEFDFMPTEESQEEPKQEGEAPKPEGDNEDEDEDNIIKAKSDKKKKDKEDKKKKKEDKKRKKEEKEKKKKRERDHKDDEKEHPAKEERKRKEDTTKADTGPAKKAKVDPAEAYLSQEERRRLETGKKSIRTDQLMEFNEDLENAILTGCLSRQRDILAELAFYGPRLDQLKETGIGKTVVKLINTPLQPLAKVLIQMWKTLIHEPSVSSRKPTFTQMEPSQTHRLSQEPQSVSQEAEGSTQSTLGTSAAEGQPSQDTEPAQEATVDTAHNTEVAIQKLPEGDYRTGMHAKLVNAFSTKDPEGNVVPLAKHAALVDHLAREIVAQLETSYPVDEKGKRTQQMTRYRQILTNLEDPKNADFRHRVLSKPSPYDLVKTMSVTEMANPEKRKERKETTEYMRDAMRTDYAEPAVTDQFQCGRCKARKTTYFQMQTRSADEPMTTFVTCVNCGNAWKFC
eukprot:TRINITY_DN163_c0_g1_i5.p1 TRINITY_DN163_c0_g1~~TRINITY_DN163_c0_g1_i5.p1  ORF type:complete len:592 (+),score=156.15 TRINITY_DN163_c0_g1_i5:671-2446(+)